MSDTINNSNQLNYTTVKTCNSETEYTSISTLIFLFRFFESFSLSPTSNYKRVIHFASSNDHQHHACILVFLSRFRTRFIQRTNIHKRSNAKVCSVVWGWGDKGIERLWSLGEKNCLECAGPLWKVAPRITRRCVLAFAQYETKHLPSSYVIPCRRIYISCGFMNSQKSVSCYIEKNLNILIC